MKTKIIIALMSIIALALSVVSFKMSYDQKSAKTTSGVDSAYVAQTVTGYNNPEFETPLDAYAFRQIMWQEQYQDSIFTSLSLKNMEDVCAVLISKGLPLTINNVVSEYNSGKGIYDVLPKVPDSTGDDRSKEQCTKKDTIEEYNSIASKDTVINNQSVTMYFKK